MTELPLQTSLAASQKPEKERISSVIASGIMCGVLVFDHVQHLHTSLILLMGFVWLYAARPLAMAQMIAIFMVSFTAGGTASQIEQFIKAKDIIRGQGDHLITAVIIDSERQQNQRARLWLADIKSAEPIEGLGTLIAPSSMIRATIDQMPDMPVPKGTIFTGHLRLYPLSAPLFPGWPDYARKSWSQGIIGTAYGRAPKLTPPPHSPSHDHSQDLFERVRQDITHHVTADLSVQNAKLALALFIGERDFSNRDFYEPFRQSGLAHLLAISGLHMGLFCFGVYGLFRFILAMPVRLSAYVGHHKIAAILALMSGGFYLLLAQMPLSAIRAYLMTALIFVALLWGRRTVTLRNVNIVFILFLLSVPSSLYVPAFQLSFAATFAITVFHEAMRRNRDIMQSKWLRRFCYLVATSVVAIISTFFITAFHFGSFTIWGVLANIFAIPFTGLVVMPVGVIYLCSLLLGIGDLIAPFLNLALGLLINFAKVIAALPFSDIALMPPPPVYLPIFGLGFLWLYLATPRWQILIMGKGVLLVALWFGQMAPIGAISPSGESYRIAVMNDGALIHSHRLTSFWADSYEKLLGAYHNSAQVRCRYGCQIGLSNGDRIVFATSHKALHCPKGSGLILARRVASCPDYQTLIIGQDSQPAILYHNERLGYYIKTGMAPQIKRAWHP